MLGESKSLVHAPSPIGIAAKPCSRRTFAADGQILDRYEVTALGPTQKGTLLKAEAIRGFGAGWRELVDGLRFRVSEPDRPVGINGECRRLAKIRGA
jgi:hypothetical protein